MAGRRGPLGRGSLGRGALGGGSFGRRALGDGALGGGLLLRPLLGRRAGRAGRRLGRPRLRLRHRIAGLGDVERVIELGAASPAAQALRSADQERAALGARSIRDRRVVHREVAVGVALAPVHQAEPGPLLDDLALLALRAGHARRLGRVLLDVPAFRVPGAADERTEPTELPLQLAPTVRAGLVEHLGLGTLLSVEVADVLAPAVLLGEPRAPDEEPVPPQPLLQAARRGPALLDAAGTVLVELLDEALELLLRAFERVGERNVELAQHLHALQIALGDLVEVLLHLGREVHVHDVGEVLDELVGDDLADVVGEEASILEPDVPAVLDRRDDRGVRRWPSDAELLQRLDEGGLGEARRRLREVLLGQDLEERQQLIGRELREPALALLVGTVVPPLRVHAQVAVEDHGAPGRAEPVPGRPGGRIDVHAHLVEPSLCHLRRHGPLPDQRVQPQLVPIQRGGHPVGCPQGRRRPDRLVGLLRVPRPSLEPSGLGQGVLGAELRPHELSDLAQSRVGDGERVGPHVGDQPDRALPGQVHSFIEALGERHRLAGAEPELACRLLLQGRGLEGRPRPFLPLLALHLGDPVVGLPKPLDVFGGLRLGRQEHALLVGRARDAPFGHADQTGEERPFLTLGREPGVDAPILDRGEASDLALALDDQPEGDRLHAPGRQARLHTAPQERRDLVADQPVEDPAGLLSVEQLQVDLARPLEGLEDRVARDLGERDALGLSRVDAEERRDVVRDRLTLPVVVRREDQVLVRPQRLLQGGDVLLRVLRNLVRDLEPVVDVDAEIALREIADVAVRSPDGVVAAQVLLDRLRLGR